MKRLYLSILLAVMVIAAGWYNLMQNKENKMNDLARTDPELAALWSNFINRDILPNGAMDTKIRYLVILAAHIAIPSPEEYRLVLKQALDSGISPVEVKETVYQAIPYAGMGKVYDFLKITNEVLQERGIKLPLEGQSSTIPQNRFDKGLGVQTEIFGEQIAQIRRDAPRDLKHIQDYLSANCFGDYYTRRGLDIKTRELLTFSMLVAMGGADSQVKAHVQGNLNVGNGREVLLDTVTQLLPYIGYPRSLNGIAAINSVTNEK